MRDIPGYENKYAITEDGRIWTYPTPKGYNGKPHEGQWMKTRIKNNGYKEVCLRKPGQQKYFLVHRLVALAYLKTDTKRKVVNHKDGIKSNNELSNLEWSTMRENIHHARDVLGAYIGKRNG